MLGVLPINPILRASRGSGERPVFSLGNEEHGGNTSSSAGHVATDTAKMALVREHVILR